MMTPKQIAVAGAGVLALAGLFAIQTKDPVGTGQKPLPVYNMAGGYLPAGETLSGLSEIPPPPAPGTDAMRKDEDARLAALKLTDHTRYVQAVADLKRGTAETLRSFSCALGVDISEQATPKLSHLLERMRIDVRRVAGPLRAKYKRARPYKIYKTKTCSPADEALVEQQGSYPSARTAVGWSYALVLAELNPARSSVILQRGRDFGQSRIICDAQWQSDVDAGRKVGELVLDRLHREKAFQADLQSAKAEVARVLRSGAAAPRQCSGPAAVASR